MDPLMKANSPGSRRAIGLLLIGGMIALAGGCNSQSQPPSSQSLDHDRSLAAAGSPSLDDSTAHGDGAVKTVAYYEPSKGLAEPGAAEPFDPVAENGKYF